MAEAAQVWIVDDDRSVRFVLAAALGEAGLRVTAFADAAEVLAALQAGRRPDLLLTDVRMPGDSGLVLLDRLKAVHPQLPVIVMSAHTDVASTAGAFRGGAQEFLSKPFDMDDAVALIERALPVGRVRTPQPAAPPAPAEGEPALVGQAPAMRELFRAIGRLAQVPLSVLITGETGTGKELVARALHRESPRAARPFVALNTAAIPAELLESELFGHEAGAFTGANRRQLGRFEQANGGTLFLDEIGDMPAALQTRLLVRLRLPPLRDRREDIPQLAARFLDHAARTLKLPAKKLSAPALERLRAHAWPGNVRELENVCWRLAALAPGDTIGAADLALALPAAAAAPTQTDADWTQALDAWARAALAQDTPDLHAVARERLDRTLLEAALALHGGHRGDAAEALGLSRNTVTRKLGSSRKRR